MTTPDPFRALDGVEPADRWDEIVERAERPTLDAPASLDDGRPVHRRPALLVAAVLAVLAVGAVALAATRHDGREQLTAGPGEADPPAALWGRSWDLVAITEHGEARPVAPAMSGGALRLDATQEGAVSVQGCNRVGGQVRLEGDRLVPVEGIFATAAGCIGGAGEAAMAQDDLLQGLFARPDGVLVVVRGDELTLSGGDVVTRWSAAQEAVDGSFWGQRWRVTDLVSDGEPVALRPTQDGDGEPGPQVLDTTDGTAEAGSGVIRVTGSCAAARQGTAELGEAGVLVADAASWERSLPVCAMADPASEQTAAIVAVLLAAPTVVVDGTVLTIATADGRHRLVAEVDPVAGGPTAGGPAQLWDHKWEVDRLVDDGVDRALALPGDGRPVVLVANTAGFPQTTSGGIPVDSEATGAISVDGCNGAGGPAHLDGDVLVADPGGFDDATGEAFPGWASTEVACTGPDGEALMAQDTFLATLLQSGPTVRIVGDRLTIEQGGDRIEATLLPGEGEGGGTDPGATTSTAPEGTTTSEPLAGTTTTVAPTIPLPGTSVPVAGADAFFDRRWTVTAVSGEGASPAFEGATVDTRSGRVLVSGCNGAGGTVRVEDDQLVPDAEWASTAKGCLPADGEDLEAQDAWFDALLRSRPTLEVRGMVATLTTATAEVELLMS